jgi:hypothetical protein
MKIENERNGKPPCADNLQPGRVGTLADRGERREVAGVVASEPIAAPVSTSAFGGKADIKSKSIDVRL